MTSPTTLPSETQRLCARLENGEIDRQAFLEQATRMLTTEIRCSSSGIWVFAGDAVHCLAMYDGGTEQMIAAATATGGGVAAYALALVTEGKVVAGDAQHHLATAALFDGFLKPQGVRSLLAMRFSVNGQMFGAFTCAQVDRQVEWDERQIGVMRLMAGRLSLGLAAVLRASPLDTDYAPLLPLDITPGRP